VDARIADTGTLGPQLKCGLLCTAGGGPDCGSICWSDCGDGRDSSGSGNDVGDGGHHPRKYL